MQHTQTVVELVRDQTTDAYTDDLAAASGNLFWFFLPSVINTVFSRNDFPSNVNTYC